MRMKVLRSCGTVAIVFAYLLSAVGHAEGVVLCISDTGRVVLQFAGSFCADGPAAEEHHGAGRATIPGPAPSSGAGCTRCVEIPVPVSSAAPHTGPGQDESPRGQAAAFALSAVPLAPVEMRSDTLSAPSPPAASSSLASLRTIVLLI